MINEAIVLAGGMGTRLRSVVKEVPKPMAPINGRPFLEYLMDYLIGQGIEKVVFSVGYKSGAITDYFGCRYKGCEIDYAFEENPLGTGGAIRLAMEMIKGSDVLVTNGDSLFLVDISKEYLFHKKRNAMATLALKPMRNFDRYGCVLVDDDGKIIRFEEKKPMEKGLINGGMYLFDVQKFMKVDMPEKFSIESEFFERFVDEGYFFGYREDAYFLDIGIPEDFAQAKKDFLHMDIQG